MFENSFIYFITFTNIYFITLFIYNVIKIIRHGLTIINGVDEICTLFSNAIQIRFLALVQRLINTADPGLCVWRSGEVLSYSFVFVSLPAFWSWVTFSITLNSKVRVLFISGLLGTSTKIYTYVERSSTRSKWYTKLSHSRQRETLDFTFYIGSTPTFYISICISTLPTQHTTFILKIALIFSSLLTSQVHP